MRTTFSISWVCLLARLAAPGEEEPCVGVSGEVVCDGSDNRAVVTNVGAGHGGATTQLMGLSISAVVPFVRQFLKKIKGLIIYSILVKVNVISENQRLG